MKRVSVLSALLGLGAAVHATNVVSMPIRKSSPAKAPLGKRTSTYTGSLYNNITGGGYYTTVSIGTPAQDITLVIDTGSSDTWLLSVNADLCTNTRLQNEYDGGCLTPYNSGQSSTYNNTKLPFDISYVDGTGTKGTYFTDTFNMAGAKVTALQMGLGTTTTIGEGLIGLGFDSDEAAQTQYPDLVDELYMQGLIETRAFSLYLDDYQSTTGNILFGGVDTEKYIDQLIAVPILKDSTTDTYSSYSVSLSAFSVDSGNGTTTNYTTSAVAVVLDSGTTLTYLPSSMTKSLYENLNAYDDSEGVSGLVFVDCDYLDESSVTFDFQFGGSSGPTIKVPMNQIVTDDVQEYFTSGELDGSELPFSDKNVCALGIIPSTGYYLLGDSFLRSAYVVYDLDKLEIGLGQANYNSTKTNVVAMTKTSGIPGLSGVASQVQATQTATGIPGPGGATGTGTAGATGTGTGTGTTGGVTSGNASPRGVPAPDWQAVGVAAMAGLGMVFGGMLIVA